MFRTVLTAALVAVLVHVPAARACPPVEDPAAGLVVTISGTHNYTLDRGGLTAEEYEKKLRLANGAGEPLPVPQVKLKVTVKNTSDKTVRVSKDTQLTLLLKGKGAVNLELDVLQKFRVPAELTVERDLELAAGASETLEINSLCSGQFMCWNRAYWTVAGDYELVAEMRVRMNAAPKDAKPVEFNRVLLTSKPFKLTVTEKGPAAAVPNQS